MSDFDRDPRVDRLLHDVGSTVAGYLDPPGANAVYARVRQRRRNRVMAVGALAVALLAGPAVGVALASGERSGPPAGGSSPSQTASAAAPSPSDSASPSPSPSASTSPTPAAPDGRISLRDLKRAKLDLPPWPATAEPGCERGSGVEIVGEPVYTDVDHDGAKETAAWLRCHSAGEYKISKVTVFDRDAAGKVVTLGQVLETATGGDDGVVIRKVWQIQATDDGQLRVDVGDYYPCCSTAADLPQHQWRTYGWDGRRFVQTGGPTKFGPNPKVIDVRVTAGDLVMTETAAGSWRGTLTVKVDNLGPFAAPVRVLVNGRNQFRATGTGTGWDRCIGVPDGTAEFSAVCEAGTMRAGASQTLSLTFTSGSKPSGALGVAAFHETDDGGYPDLHYDDNGVEVAVTTG
jgi:hypothetical protein